MSTPAAVDLGALFERATLSVVRVETLPVYDVGGEEEERITAWRNGAPRPERSVRTSVYLQRVAAAVARGVAWERLRVIDSPPTEYQRYELQGYVESQAVGERVILADRGDLGVVADLDAWIIDGAIVVAQDYDTGGAHRGNRRADDAERARAFLLADRIRDAGVPLNVYLAGSVPATRRAS